MTATAVAAFVAGVTAVAAVADGHADAGVVMEAPGGHVLSASPTGFAWTSGIRAGQQVIAFTPAYRGWMLVTTDGQTQFTSYGTLADQALRDSAPLAVAGLGAGIASLLLRRTRRDWVVAMGSAGIFLAAVPLWLQGGSGLSTLAMAAALVVPGVWLLASASLPVWLRVALLLGMGGLVAVWAASRLNGADSYPDLEHVRGQLAAVATLGVVFVNAVRPVLAGRPVNLTRPAFVDLLVVAGLSLISISLVALDVVSPFALGAVLLGGLLVVPALRARLGQRFERTVLGDMREHARAEGADEERAKLARELHDDHLQELVAVIRHLEVKPGTEAERDELRDLAARLRTVAEDLRPPVLDDFGLHAALEHVAEHVGSEDCPVHVNVHDGTGLDRAQRPPADVELALYRIAGEAIANAVRHAKASRVEVTGEVEPDAIAIEVADNGIGVTNAVLRNATGRNRMGVGSMRRRAAAIDADFAIEGSGAGTTVRVRWHR